MESPSKTTAESLTSSLDHVARRLHSHGYASNLFPAQWAALRYFLSAEAGQRTAIDLARHQGLASGAVARTVRTLVSKGLVEKVGPAGRGRAERLDLTERGTALLKKDPLDRVTAALQDLPQADKEAFERGLKQVARATGPIERRSG